MTEDLTDCVYDLVELFPAAQEDQKALYKTEVSVIRETQDIIHSNTITCDDDD